MGLHDWLMAVGGLVCGQDPERSVEFFGRQAPLCSRCLGIYATLFAGLGYQAVRRTRRLDARGFRLGLLALFLAVLFMLGDVFWFEPLRPSHLVRFISGSFVGAALAFLLWGCAAVLWTTDERRRNHETAK